MFAGTLSENWVALSKEKNRELFSELDVLLRALDRYFTIEHLPIGREDLSSRNFVEELSNARDVILRILGILEVIVPENKRNIYWFQKFAVAKYMDDSRRDAFRGELYKQDIPEKSLLLLYDSFINLKGIITDILKAEHIPYTTFTNIGHVIAKEIRENTYFNPFRKDLDPEYDSIRNREISKVVKGIKDRDTKKSFSVILLHLFRFLRYLQYADNANRFDSLSSSLLIILLLRSEFTRFRSYIENLSNRLADEGLKTLIGVLSYQFSVESKRVFQQELKEAFISKTSPHLKGKLENSHGILKNLSEQSVIQLVQSLKPDIVGTDIFHSFVTKFEQSLKLREDLLILHRFLTVLEDAENPGVKETVFRAMRNFMLYFQSFTFRLLRYDDYEEFASFFDRVLSFPPGDMSGKSLDRLMEKVKQFRIFVETCLRQLSNRTELSDKPIDEVRIDASIKQYLS